MYTRFKHRMSNCAVIIYGKVTFKHATIYNTIFSNIGLFELCKYFRFIYSTTNTRRMYFSRGILNLINNYITYFLCCSCKFVKHTYSFLILIKSFSTNLFILFVFSTVNDTSSEERSLRLIAVITRSLSVN